MYCKQLNIIFNEVNNFSCILLLKEEVNSIEQAVFVNNNSPMLSESLYLTSCGISKTLPGHTCMPELSSQYLIHFVLSGKGYLVKNRIKYPLTTGQIFIIKPQEIATYYADIGNPWTYCWVSFGGNEVPNIMKILIDEEMTSCFPVKNIIDYSNLVLELLKYPPHSLINELKTKELSYRILYKLSTASIVKIETEEFVNLNQISNLTSSIIELVSKNYQSGIGVQDISNILSFNRSYLSRKFKNEIGISIQNWLLYIRIEKSCHYLAFTNLSVEKISQIVGFQSSELFTRNFKKVKELTPLSYRKKIRNNYETSFSMKHFEQLFSYAPVVDKVPRPIGSVTKYQ